MTSADSMGSESMWSAWWSTKMREWAEREREMLRTPEQRAWLQRDRLAAERAYQERAAFTLARAWLQADPQAANMELRASMAAAANPFVVSLAENYANDGYPSPLLGPAASPYINSESWGSGRSHFSEWSTEMESEAPGHSVSSSSESQWSGSK